MIIHFFLKENYTLYETRKNKMIAAHRQTGCGVARAVKAGNQPEHMTAEWRQHWNREGYD